MKHESITDEQIVRQVLLGNTESFRIIVERYQRPVFGMGMRFFRNRDDAGDFTQEVFLKAYEALGSYAGRAPFRFWLMRIAYHHGISRMEALRTTEQAITDEMPANDESPEQGSAKNEIREILHEAVRRLPERYRICVDLYFFLELTYAEISEITGFPVNTIKSHVLRAKAILRDGLKGTAAEEYHEL